jgi:hypothetical protein
MTVTYNFKQDGSKLTGMAEGPVPMNLKRAK